MTFSVPDSFYLKCVACNKDVKFTMAAIPILNNLGYSILLIAKLIAKQKNGQKT